ncbi:MAG: Fe-S protein assembly co-chaperone HscB [Acidobacteriota bacterium]
MTSETSAVPVQPCRHCGTHAPVSVHFCPRCEKILTLGRHGDYFRFFGLPRRLDLDQRDLEQRFRALSRQFHPDYYHNASPAERLASLERSSYLNDAFRTLRDPIGRLEYLLRLEGFAPKQSRDATAQVPAGLLEEVFELNEELEAIQDMRLEGAGAGLIAVRLEQARQPVEAKLDEHNRRLADLGRTHDAQLDAGDDEARTTTLATLRTLLLERTYLTNLLSTIRREMSGEDPAGA